MVLTFNQNIDLWFPMFDMGKTRINYLFYNLIFFNLVLLLVRHQHFVTNSTQNAKHLNKR